MRNLLILLMLFASPATWAQCLGVDPQEAFCIPIDLYFETDPSGIGNTVRFTGRMTSADQIGHDKLAAGTLHGPVRWYIDAIAFAESGIIKLPGSGSRSFVTFLLIEDLDATLAKAGIVLNPASEVFAEYVGDEFYAGVDSNCGQQGETVCKIAFQGQSAFDSLQPLRAQYSRWDATIRTDKNIVSFADPVEITTTWVLPGEFEQNGIAGRFFLFADDDVVGTAPISILGLEHSPALQLSTLAPGDYTFEAAYVGTEGALNIVSSESITVIPPKRALTLGAVPPNPVARAGIPGALEVCAKTTTDTLPPELEGLEVSIDISVSATAESAEQLSSTQVAVLDFDGCAAVATDGLAPGRYSVAANLTENDGFLGASASGQLTIIPVNALSDIVVDLPATAGTQAAELMLIAPIFIPHKSSEASDTSFEPLPLGLVLQAVLDTVSDTQNIPTGAMQLFINGQFVSSQILESGGATLLTFSALQLPSGEYTATLVYSGDDVFASIIGKRVGFLVEPNIKAHFFPQDGLLRPVPDLKGTMNLELLLDVNSVIDGQPLIMTGHFRAPSGVLPTGVPAGRLVFFDGATELGAVPINSYSAAILLPAGLPPGIHDLTVEYRE